MSRPVNPRFALSAPRVRHLGHDRPTPVRLLRSQQRQRRRELRYGEKPQDPDHGGGRGSRPGRFRPRTRDRHRRSWALQQDHDDRRAERSPGGRHPRPRQDPGDRERRKLQPRHRAQAPAGQGHPAGQPRRRLPAGHRGGPPPHHLAADRRGGTPGGGGDAQPGRQGRRTGPRERGDPLQVASGLQEAPRGRGHRGVPGQGHRPVRPRGCAGGQQPVRTRRTQGRHRPGRRRRRQRPAPGVARRQDQDRRPRDAASGRGPGGPAGASRPRRAVRFPRPGRRFRPRRSRLPSRSATTATGTSASCAASRQRRRPRRSGGSSPGRRTPCATRTSLAGARASGTPTV